ncbi:MULTISPECIES: TetR/AcrR family transcriptional regulator [Nocardiopsis]|uniref:HTH tetR-type domain-containing protein n=1 Tax=Nocardiopsis sinuspersici TaxID=501010 RepID=A0A1V3C3B6_9ACTN|nr:MULTISPECIES: TetR/AcrR family transcriptional regulator [Nocardiopsis]OOC55294.1 hypothetical protein NOSIN_16955 [Nocardiopsis sinuspersici]
MGRDAQEARDPAAVPTRRDRRRARSRSALLEAARESFRRRGFTGTTVSDITERADVAHGTFYSYFPSKDEVFTEIVDAVLHDMLASLHEVGGAASIRQRLGAGLGSLLRLCEREREIILALHQASQLRGEYRRKWDGFRERLRQTVEQDLGWLHRNGSTRPIRVDLVATVVARMVEGVALEVITSPETDVDALVATTVDLYYDAVFRPLTGEDDIAV